VSCESGLHKKKRNDRSASLKLLEGWQRNKKNALKRRKGGNNKRK
jgi:hypothetical protein